MLSISANEMVQLPVFGQLKHLRLFINQPLTLANILQPALSAMTSLVTFSMEGPCYHDPLPAINLRGLKGLHSVDLHDVL